MVCFAKNIPDSNWLDISTWPLPPPPACRVTFTAGPQTDDNKTVCDPDGITATKVYTLSDSTNSNSLTCKDSVHIPQDTVDPVFADCSLQPLSVDCGKQLPGPSSCTFTDRCPTGLTNCTKIDTGKLVRVYTATDTCGNHIEKTQDITFNNLDDPTLYEGCSKDNHLGTFPGIKNPGWPYQDSCSVNLVPGSLIETGDICYDMSVIQHYTLTDGLYSFDACTQTLHIHDTTPPKIVDVTCDASLILPIVIKL